MHPLQKLKIWLSDVRSVRWRDAIVTLRERFREDRLGLTAGSLTFTTTIALVPFVTVALAVFTAFPIFSHFQDVLQKWLLTSLVPDTISRQVLGYLSQFAVRSSRLGTAGLVLLLASALALIFTIDRTLNSIWRVRARRAFGQRLLIYWAAITLGPVLLGASLSLMSYALSLSSDVVGHTVSGSSLRLLLGVIEFLLGAGGMAALFHYVPNTFVRWGHAWMGGLFVAAGLELARKLLALYLVKVPTYSLVYGAFATVPIFLIWIYTVWVLVLLGATLTAYLPSLIAGIPRRRGGFGWQFVLALDILRALDAAARIPQRGLTLVQICANLQADAQRVEPVIEALLGLDWVALLNESAGPTAGGRYVLLADPVSAPVDALVQALLLPRSPATEKLWRNGRWNADCLRDVL